MTTTTFFCSMLLLTSPVDVSGQVVNEQGQGVAGAIVAISSAKPKTGPILVCPTCYADCAKRVQADADGKFTISGLSSDLLFSLKSGAPGYHGTVSELIDPTAHSPIKLQISTLLSVRDKPCCEEPLLTCRDNRLLGQRCVASRFEVMVLRSRVTIQLSRRSRSVDWMVLLKWRLVKKLCLLMFAWSLPAMRHSNSIGNAQTNRR